MPSKIDLLGSPSCETHTAQKIVFQLEFLQVSKSKYGWIGMDFFHTKKEVLY